MGLRLRGFLQLNYSSVDFPRDQFSLSTAMEFESESESEFFADNLSDIEQPDLSDDSDSEDIFTRRRNPRIPLQSSTSSDSEDEIIPDWSETDTEPVIEDFLGQVGVVMMPENPASIMSVLQLFIGDDLFEYMAQETNRYHAQNIHKFKVSAKTLKWRDVSVSDMKKMMGLLLLMGKVRKDSRDEYWSTDETIETPIFARILSRDRFRQIWAAWHFSNNAEADLSADRLQKVRPILDYFLPKFKNVYKPKRELSLDESIMAWRGRLVFKVYNASKINKYGVLIRMVCEATSGYVCNLRVYSGQGYPLQATILHLLDPYLNLWHHVYMDNFYNSVDTSELLLRNKVRSCGTIRQNRGLPLSLKNIKLQKGQTSFRRRQDVLLQVWQHKRTVRMISTIHSATMVESENMDWATKEKIWKPISIIDYNKFMKGVDRADQYLSYFSIVRRTKKWTKRLTMYLFNCALFNSFHVFRTINAVKKTYKSFLLHVAKEWIKAADEVAEEAVPSTSRASNRDTPTRLSLDARKHKCINITGNSVHRVQRQCKVCAAKKKKSRTCFMCQQCNVPLHKGDCFFSYHTSQK